MIKQYKTLDRIKEAVEKTNPLVTKDIMEKLEKFGTSPVSSLNGKIVTTKLGTLEEEVREELNDALKELGFSENDFWLTIIDTTIPKIGATYPITGKITIISKKTGKSKEYQTNNETKWIADFSKDLAQGFYK